MPVGPRAGAWSSRRGCGPEGGRRPDASRRMNARRRVREACPLLARLRHAGAAEQELPAHHRGVPGGRAEEHVARALGQRGGEIGRASCRERGWGGAGGGGGRGEERREGWQWG